jgi:hypothetical protein
MEQGFHDLSYNDYEADPCPEPSLRSGIAKVLLNLSPKHAWYEHPRLNEDWKPREEGKFDVGIAAHAMVVGGDRVVRLPEEFKDYKKHEVRKLAAEVRDRGGTPLLDVQYRRTRAMFDTLLDQLGARGLSHVFTDPKGKGEQSVIWEENGTWLRSRPDWVLDSTAGMEVWDYKTTAKAHPTSWAKIAFNTGADIQAAMVISGIKAITGTEPRFRFVVQDVTPPHLISIVGLSPLGLDMGERKLNRAVELWGECLDTGCWPGYPAGEVFIDPPGYHDVEWQERLEVHP